MPAGKITKVIHSNEQKNFEIKDEKKITIKKSTLVENTESTHFIRKRKNQ